MKNIVRYMFIFIFKPSNISINIDLKNPASAMIFTLETLYERLSLTGFELQIGLLQSELAGNERGQT